MRASLRLTFFELLQGRCHACGQARALRSVRPEWARFLCEGCQARLAPSAIATPDKQAFPPLRRVLVFGPYQGLLRELILDFKFAGRLGCAALLQGLLVEAWRPGPGAETPLMVPLPLHRLRLRERGFNQSLELCARLARRQGLDLSTRALARIRNTRPQRGLPRAERLRNLVDAFQGRPELVRGRVVLLVDDVLTTGASLREAASALLGAGAQAVDAIVLARTPPPATPEGA